MLQKAREPIHSIELQPYGRSFTDFSASKALQSPLGVALPPYGGEVDERCSMELTPYYKREGDSYTLTIVLTEYFGSTHIEMVHEEVTLYDEEDIINEATDAQWRASSSLEAFGVIDPVCDEEWGKALIRIIDRENAVHP